MALSLREKRTLQFEVETCVDSLAQKLGLREKRSFQERLQEALDKLLGAVTTAVKTMLDRLLSGEFLSLSPQDFIAKVEEAFNEVKDLTQIYAPVDAYIAQHAAEIPELASENSQGDAGIMESAGAPAFRPGGNSGTCDIVIDIDNKFDAPMVLHNVLRVLRDARPNDTVVLKLSGIGGRA